MHRVAHSFHLAPLGCSFRVTSEDPTPSAHRSFRLTHEGPLFRRSSRSVGAILGLHEPPESREVRAAADPRPGPSDSGGPIELPPDEPKPTSLGTALSGLGALDSQELARVGAMTQVVMAVNYTILLSVMLASIVNVLWSIEPILMVLDSL